MVARVVVPDAPTSPMRPPEAAVTLLRQADAGLMQADRAGTPTSRFAQARMAALRAAAAVLAVRTVPTRSSARARPTNVWRLLARVAPELGEWATFYAACATMHHITVRDADDMLRQAQQFVALAKVAASLGSDCGGHYSEAS